MNLTYNNTSLYFFLGVCNRPILLKKTQLRNQTYTCPYTNSTVTESLGCCWLIPPTTGLKLRILSLSPKDSLIINEIGNDMEMTSIWNGNHTCSDGVQKCPFKLTNTLFSAKRAYRMIEIQMDRRVVLKRTIHLDVFAKQGTYTVCGYVVVLCTFYKIQSRENFTNA